MYPSNNFLIFCIDFLFLEYQAVTSNAAAGLLFIFSLNLFFAWNLGSQKSFLISQRLIALFWMLIMLDRLIKILMFFFKIQMENGLNIVLFLTTSLFPIVNCEHKTIQLIKNGCRWAVLSCNVPKTTCLFKAYISLPYISCTIRQSFRITGSASS